MKYVIIVNGGVWIDVALATDFAAFFRYFTTQQDTDVVGLVSFDLRLTPALLQRGEMFPQLVQAEPQSLKDIFIDQIEERSGMLQAGDPFLICILAHGAQNGAALLGQNFLSKFELRNALRLLNAGARVSIINTACFGEMALVDMNCCERSSQPVVEVGRRTLWNNPNGNCIAVPPVVRSAVLLTEAEKRASFLARLWENHAPGPVTGLPASTNDLICELLKEEVLPLQQWC